MDLYTILEIKPTASEIEIKKAYHRLAKLYHPDKNKSPGTVEKFQKIQTAYEILINNTTRHEYIKMTQPDQTSFVDIMNKIISETFDINDLKEYNINLDKIDFEYITKNCINFFKAINAGELLNFFKKGIVPKKNLNNMINCSESENSEDCAEYYYNLPISVQKINPLDIILDINITLYDIINKTKKKVKIKRKTNDTFETHPFIFDVSSPYIVFYGMGDIVYNDTGNLIIRLITPKNILWSDDLILIEQSMTLYELIYGLNISLDLGNNIKIEYECWVPSRDGYIIELSDKVNINMAIKLYLDYNDMPEKHEILKKYFS